MTPDSQQPTPPDTRTAERREAEPGIDPAGRGTLVSLAIIMAVAVGLRLAYIIVTARPGGGFAWSDPDGYMSSGIDMARGGHDWVETTVRFYQYVKAPLYPFLLWFFALAPAYPLSAAVVQVLLNGIVAVWALFSIGRTLHSSRTGLIAAAAFAVLGHAITGATLFMQENVVIPLTLAAFAVFLRAAAVPATPVPRFGIAGLVFGAAALVRSMPLYFVPAAALMHVVAARERRRAFRQASALVLVFCAVILPYCVVISLHEHRVVLIDNQGTRYIVLRYSAEPEEEVPGTIDAARMLSKAFTADPGSFVRDRWDVFNSLFILRAGNWLQTAAPVATSASGAMITKVLAHVFQDLPVALIVMLSPFGFAFARNRMASAFLLLWVLINVVLMTTFLWGSARYRASFEAQLMVAASVVAAGQWRRPSRRVLWGAGLATLVLAGIVMPSVPDTLHGHSNYGITPLADNGSSRARSVVGRAGLNMRTGRQMLRFSLRTSDADPVVVDISVDGSTLRRMEIAPGTPSSVRFPLVGPRLAFVEFDVISRASGKAGRLEVELPPGPVRPTRGQPRY